MIVNNKSDSDIQQAYKTYVSQKRFSELAKLMKTSQSKPADYIIRLGFKSYMEQDQGNRVKLFSVMKLKEITGITPDQNVMKLSCEIALEMDSTEVIEALINRIGIEKSVFQELGAVLQKMYSRYVQEGRFVDISRLMELTDLLPTQEIIHKGYEYYLAEGKFISFAGLKKRTEIPPDETMIQDVYREYYVNYRKFQKISREKAELWSDYIKKLKRISKIDPEGFSMEDLEEEQKMWEEPEESDDDYAVDESGESDDDYAVDESDESDDDYAVKEPGEE